MIYTIQVNGRLHPECYTSLTVLCRNNELPYGSVSKGRRIFIQGENVIRISELKVIKIKK